ncbi:hypothetical protein HPB52_011139 [Rhipicephalus sanguineus]|uniref:Uncharacterized protein n=1 Tax=Rhipicephalus sanguineus TaxID=34632 RepID=A0A9D4T5L8_RHISA|nr:hypothetical protein HPB52_011139 [Rhipicephalus sanguineus]
MDTAHRTKGCSTCGIGAFKNKEEPKERSRREPSAESRGKPSKRATIGRSRSDSSHRRKSTDYSDSPCSKDDSFEADSLPGEEYVDDDEMNRNWNGPPRFPMAPYNRGASFGGYRGRGMYSWNRPPPPLQPPYNRYDGPRSSFNTYGQHPPAGGHPPWSNDDYDCSFEPYGNGGWQGGSNRWNWDARKDTWQGNDESAPGTGSRGERTATRDNREQGGEKVSARSSGSLSKLHISNEKPSPARSSTAVSARLRSSTAAAISVHISNRESPLSTRSLKSTVAGTTVAVSSKEPAARRGESGVKSDSSCQSQKKDSTVQEPSKIIRILKKPSPQAHSVKCASWKAKPMVNLGLSTRSRAPDVSKALAGSSKTGATSSSTLSGKLGQHFALSGSQQGHGGSEEGARRGRGKLRQKPPQQQSSSSSNRNHLIFVSSEEDDTDAHGKETSNRQARRDDNTSTTEKAAKRTLMSPKLGPLSTKDVYRRDVLDKLVNFPSSPQVQAQLNKWMMEMQKSQRSVMPRKTMKLCTTQARLGQDDDPLLGSIPSINFDVLVRQVESCELPEEMLKSLMHALNTDAEQPHSTAGEVPPPIATGLGSKGSGSQRATPELRSSPLSTTPSGSSSVAARSPATKASTALAKSSSAAESPSAKSASGKSVKSAAAPSSTGTSSSEDECVVVPAPKKKVVPVVIDSDEHNPTDEEDNRPSTTTPTVKVLEGKLSSPPPAQQRSKQVRRVQKPARRKGRKPSGSADSTLVDGAAASPTPLPPVEPSSDETAAAEFPRESKRPPSRSKSATPTTSNSCTASTPAVSSSGATSISCVRRRSQASVSPSTFPEVISCAKLWQESIELGGSSGESSCHAPWEQPASGRSPLPSVAPTPSPPLETVITKMEPPPTPPPAATPPDDTVPLNSIPLGAMPSGAVPSGTMPTDTKPPVQVAMKSLVNDLAQRCQLEDTIRQELAHVEQGIASALASLEELKKRKEETQKSSTWNPRNKNHLCRLGAASALPGDGQPLLHFTLPAQSAAAMEMFSSFGTSGSDVMFGVSQVPPPGGTPPVIAGQIAQLLLPHLQQFGTDIDINKLSTSLGQSGLSMPTMSPEVSGGPSSRRATAKRKTARDGEPTMRYTLT